MVDLVKLSWIIAAPLLGAIINGFWTLSAARTKRTPRRLPIAIIATVAAFVSFFFSIVCFKNILSLPHESRFIEQTLFDWISVGDFHVPLALRLDPLSAIMILVVTGVGSLIHLYSIGYMSHDVGQGRFFVYLNMFLTAMLTLVLASNLPLMFVGWEGVGLCSYLLIGFWFTDPEKASAGKKAFIVNRVGDLAFVLAIFLTFATFHSVVFSELQKTVLELGAQQNSHILFAICILFFVGACGKSAQFPLHVWLPDAMAGPTPVSALIHAATMVTAGVYMVARLSFLFALSPQAGSIVAGVGVFTAVFAALIALTQTDIKKVLAYSTVSQLGYMFVGVGVGNYTAGVFHLMTHAFFKGLMFLGAGSVIHAMSEEQDIRKMGGLKKYIPITYWTFFVGWAAIAGVPPLSGFFSKDEILWSALKNGHVVIYGVGMVTAFLTAFYMTRLMALTFWGECRADHHAKEHLHESPQVMTLPLIVLAACSALAGFLGVPHFLHGIFGDNHLEHFLQPVFAAAEHLAGESTHIVGLGEGVASLLAIAVAGSGIGAAILVYVKNPNILKQLAFLNPVAKVLNNKFYIDEIYEALIIRPVYWFSVHGLWKGLDVLVIDGFINSLGRGAGFLGEKLKFLQTGQVRIYAMSIAVGTLVLLFLIGF